MLGGSHNHFILIALRTPGHCYLWQSNLNGLYDVSERLIRIISFSFQLVRIHLIHQHDDLPFSQSVQRLEPRFAVLSTTHTQKILMPWNSIYWLSGMLKIQTAIIGLAMPGTLISVIPQALHLLYPHTLDWANFQTDEPVKQKTPILQVSDKYPWIVKTLARRSLNSLILSLGSRISLRIHCSQLGC